MERRHAPLAERAPALAALPSIADVLRRHHGTLLPSSLESREAKEIGTFAMASAPDAVTATALSLLNRRDSELRSLTRRRGL
jgi:hypothetical protein